MRTLFRMLIPALAGIWALTTAPSAAQYAVTPGEMMHAARGGELVFSWNAQDRLAVWTALDQIKGPHLDANLSGRAKRVQDRLHRKEEFMWVNADGSLSLPPVKLTLPELVIIGFALSNYQCAADDQDMEQGQAETFCRQSLALAKQITDKISSYAPKLESTK